MRRFGAVLLALAALALTACGSDDGGSMSAGPVAETQEKPEMPGGGRPAGAEKPAHKERAGAEKAQAPDGTEVKIAESQFGPILFDAGDQAIYVFAKETTSQPDCYGDCAAAWPPVLTDGDPVAGAGAEAKLLGTTQRDDGSTQVTYNGQPLYYYAHEGPGEVLCHGIDEFGGLWLVVDKAGDALPA